MSTAEFLDKLDKVKIDAEKVGKIAHAYHVELNDDVSKIISCADKENFFDEDRRALSYKEILNPVKRMGIDFVSKGLIPLVDIYDNTYVVYIITEKKYALYSATDDLTFKKRKKFAELI